MKILGKIAWVVAYIIIIYGLYLGATLAFSQGVPVLDWIMVIGGALVIGVVGFYMILDIFEL